MNSSFSIRSKNLRVITGHRFGFNAFDTILLSITQIVIDNLFNDKYYCFFKTRITELRMSLKKKKIYFNLRRMLNWYLAKVQYLLILLTGEFWEYYETKRTTKMIKGIVRNVADYYFLGKKLNLKISYYNLIKSIKHTFAYKVTVDILFQV